MEICLLQLSYRMPMMADKIHVQAIADTYAKFLDRIQDQLTTANAISRPSFSSFPSFSRRLQCQDVLSRHETGRKQGIVCCPPRRRPFRCGSQIYRIPAFDNAHPSL